MRDLKNKTITIKLTRPQYDFVKAIAQTDNVTVSEVFRQSINKHLD
jgi:hypothetical protein